MCAPLHPSITDQSMCLKKKWIITFTLKLLMPEALRAKRESESTMFCNSLYTVEWVYDKNLTERRRVCNEHPVVFNKPEV